MGSLAALFGEAGRIEDIRRMLSSAPHRGREVEVNRHGSCWLGIGRHPQRPDAELVVRDGYAVAFTGVLDTLSDLLRDLAHQYPGPIAPTPGHALIAGFEVFGADKLLSRVRGAFAAVVSDGQQIWCFRDQIGLATMFFREQPDRLFVASEAKQVLAGCRQPHQPDESAVEALFYGTHDGPAPPALRGVSKLPAGTLLTADGHRSQAQPYWHPGKLLETASLSADEIRTGFQRLMTQAVARTLTGADVVALSGGIDSPTVAAFAAPEHRRLVGRPLAALTAVYPGLESVDETRYVREIADYLDIQLHTYEQEVAPFHRVQEWVRLLDGPVRMTSLQETAELYTHARRLGFETVLTGDLAEWVCDSRGYLVAHLLRSGRFAGAWRQLRGQRRRGVSLAGLGRQVAAAIVPGSLAAMYGRHRPSDRRRRIPDWLDAARVKEQAARDAAPAGERWQREQLIQFMRLDPAIEADDACQAACGIRVRRPWADVDLWEFFLRLPAEVKFTDDRSKGLVRRLLRGRLPDAVLDRTDKTVFDEFAMSRVDYESLRRWILRPRHRVAGVDYDVLARHLEREDFDLVDYNWAKDLVAVQAFLALWQ